ncbi:hypothetical protein NJB18091_30170 [Mycobacterium marinum]|uniref:hypothetical protein n=1 Tax=Mycobacterium marinum TaxID=1781 RepID=UPI0021C33424|nr:hypothetical protein [Mycobacterium marinum]GJN99548.1 hypothetical protein NJB18091_30170 [Mycobacterium marinum]
MSSRNVVLVWRIALAIAALVLAIVQSLIVTKRVDWSPWVAVVAAGAVGLLAFIDNVRLARVGFQAPERHKARSKMHKPLIFALDAICEARDVPLDVLGVSVFRIKRYWTRRWIFVPWRKSRLLRLFRFRLKDFPAESAVDWTMGKGAIGKCWETGIPHLEDRRQVAAEHGRGHYPNETQFAQLNEEQKSGFTRDEFVQTIDKYGEILAVPIVKESGGRSKMIGVVSIDCLLSAYAGRPDSVLDGVGIEEIAGGAASVVRDYVVKF